MSSEAAVRGDALSERAVHLVALVRHDQREGREIRRREIGVEPVEPDEVLRAARVELRRAKIQKARMLRSVERTECAVGFAAECGRIRHERTGRGDVLVISAPRHPHRIELRAEMRRVDRVVRIRSILFHLRAVRVVHARLAEERVVVVDAERVAAHERDVVRLAWMHLAVEARRRPVRLRQSRDVRRVDAVRDLRVVLVLFDDHEHVRVARHREIVRRRLSRRRTRSGTDRENSADADCDGREQREPPRPRQLRHQRVTISAASAIATRSSAIAAGTGPILSIAAARAACPP